MFNAVVPLTEPIIAVQIDAIEFKSPNIKELLNRLEIHFMRPVILVAWDENSRFYSYGFPCPEDMLASDELAWRKFELPSEPEIPF